MNGPEAASPGGDRHRARLVLGSLLGTFILVRTALWLSPDSDLNLGGHNVHHLFTGVVLVALSGVPLALWHGRSRLVDAACLGFGAGLALALDEVVYLVMTDGSNASYLLPVSFWGGVVFVGFGAAWVVLAAWSHVRYCRQLRIEELPRGRWVFWPVVYALALAVVGVALAIYLMLLAEV